jgi:hypothetical protein
MKSNLVMLLALGLLTSTAYGFDTTKPLLCAIIEVQECIDGAGCTEVLPEEVNVPTFLRIDIKRKEIIITDGRPVAKIAHMGEVEDRIVLQGIEGGLPDKADGAGWMISINKETGRMVFAAVGEQLGLTMFGACTEI